MVSTLRLQHWGCRFGTLNHYKSKCYFDKVNTWEFNLPRGDKNTTILVETYLNNLKVDFIKKSG